MKLHRSSALTLKKRHDPAWSASPLWAEEACGVLLSFTVVAVACASYAKRKFTKDELLEISDVVEHLKDLDDVFDLMSLLV